MQTVRPLIAAWLVAALFVGPVAMADGNSAQTPPKPADPPAKVGSVTFLENDVLQYTPDQTEWKPAQFNYPVSASTAFAAGQKGRAELELGGATARIDVNTELDIVTMDEANTALRMPQGAADLRLPAPLSGGTAVILVVTTPRGDVTLAAPGTYLIQSGNQTDPTTVGVFEGQATITGASGATFNVAGGQAALLTGDGNKPSFAVEPVKPAPIDDWAAAREQLAAGAAPLPPDVSAEIPGIRMLASYGAWEAQKKYGPVWIPRDLPPGWQPYKNGHWTNVKPWGWTWVDDAPWGFAPAHYGRWVRIKNRWAWAPGKAVAKPVYAPALVVFADVGGKVKAKAKSKEIVIVPPKPGEVVLEPVPAAPGDGADVAWYPLGWNEPYVPSYPVSNDYLQDVNAEVVEPVEIERTTRFYDRQFSGDPGATDAFMAERRFENRDRAIAIARDTFGTGRSVKDSSFTPKPAEVKPTVIVVVIPATIATPKPIVVTQPPQPKILQNKPRAPIPPKLLAPKTTPPKTPIPATTTKVAPAVTPKNPPAKVTPVVATPPQPPKPAPSTKPTPAFTPPQPPKPTPVPPKPAPTVKPIPVVTTPPLPPKPTPVPSKPAPTVKPTPVVTTPPQPPKPQPPKPAPTVKPIPVVTTPPNPVPQPPKPAPVVKPTPVVTPPPQPPKPAPSTKATTPPKPATTQIQPANQNTGTKPPPPKKPDQSNGN